MPIATLLRKWSTGAQLIRRRGFRYALDHAYHKTYYDAKRWLHRKTPWNPFAGGNLLPRVLEIEITTKCTLQCVMCENTYWDIPPRHMTFAQFRSIVDQFPNLLWIGITGIGSSFLNPDYVKMLFYMRERNVDVECFDSFLHLNEANARRMVEANVWRLFASIDAATAATYKKVRPGSDFETVWRNVKRLIALKEERGAEFPMLCFHYIISRLNIHEVVPFIERVASLGPDRVKMIYFSGILHAFKEIENLVVDVDEATIQRAEERARAWGIPLWWNPNTRPKLPVSECTAWYMPFIFSDGSVNLCCATNEANRREFQVKHSLGNAFAEPFAVIWNSESYRQAVADITGGKLPIQCAHCPIYDVEV